MNKYLTNVIFMIGSILALGISYVVLANLIFGFAILERPDHNRTTGCPNDLPTCPRSQQLLCHKNNMTTCYLFAIPCTFVFVAFIYFAILLYLRYNETFGKNVVIIADGAKEVETSDDVEIPLDSPESGNF